MSESIMQNSETIPSPTPQPAVTNDNETASAVKPALPTANDNARIYEVPEGVPGDSSGSQANATAISPAKAHIMQPAPETSAIGSWISRHRWFTREPVTYTGYQFVRSSLASVPYAFAMSLGHHVFNLFSVAGQKTGLTQQGIDTFTNGGGLAAVEKAALVAEHEIYKPGARAMVGRQLMRLGNSPMNAAVQIAMGFTLFRFTGGVVKNLRDRVINDRNTEQETVHETKNWWKTIKETARINWPAESVATPIAALVLGFMGAAYTPPAKEFMANRTKSLPFWKDVGRVWSRPSKLFQNMAVWTLSYSLFFLMGESLFKDVQIRRGLWKGHPNSLKNGPDDVVGGPGAVDYKTPENDWAVQPSAPINQSAEEGYKLAPEAKKDDGRAKDSVEKMRFPFFMGEPSLGRFMIRRVLPVAVGISAYAALKRVGYLAEVPHIKIGKIDIKPISGMMQGINVPTYEAMKVEGSALKTFGNHAKLYFGNAGREGKATAMFGALWVATDAWGTWYDKFFHNLQKPEHQVPLNDHQQEKHTELLARLNEKEKDHGRAA